MRIVLAVTGTWLALAPSAGSADAFNGTVRGTVDGHAIDVRAVCNRETMFGGPWLQAKSDPALHAGAKDRDGDGVAVVVTATQARGQAVFEVLVAGQTYKFVGERGLQFTDTGVRMQSTIEQYEGRGKDRRRVGAYEVSLSVHCPAG